MGRHSIVASAGRRVSAPIPLGRLTFTAVGCLFLANCMVGPGARTIDPKFGVAASPRVIEEGQPVPRGGGVYRVGNPYTVAGRVYTPETNPDYRAEGIASWYGRDFHGRRTANGEVFDMESISAAHPTLPIPSYVRVTHLGNRRSLVVRINDRGPFKEDRIIDLSARSAQLLGFGKNGLSRVRVEYVGPASLEGSDDRKLLATLRQDGQPAPAPSQVLVASVGDPLVPAASSVSPMSRAASIPNPPDRPFELGRYPAPSVVAERENRPARIADNAPSAQRATFVETSRPTMPVIPAATFGSGVVNGRGLY
jgi:rare lipoprotein A